MSNSNSREASMDDTSPLIYKKPALKSNNSSAHLRLPHPSSAKQSGQSKDAAGSNSANTPSASIKKRPTLFHSSSSTSVTSLSSSINQPHTYDSFSITKNRYTTGSGTITVSDSFVTYLSYYFPILSWLPRYNIRENFVGDLTAGLSLAAFQIPLVISVSCLAHADVKCGLYGLIVSPVVYSIFGSCSFLITGPEAAVALIVASLIENILHYDKGHLTQLDVVSAVSLTIGLTLFLSGIFRLGFLGNVVSQGLLNGFIAALGILMIVTELLTELGLSQFFEEVHESDPSSVDKLSFVLKNLDLVHKLTMKISVVSIIALVVARHVKSYLIKKNAKKFGWLNFFPEILCVVIISILLSNHYKWNKEGVTIIGKYFDKGQNTGYLDDKSDFRLPITFKNLKLLKKCFSTAFICAVLGFFESSTATKALENQFNIDFSLNRELVALGACNIIGSFFTMLPCFGGYGKSKINSLTAKTQLSGIILAVVTLIFYIFFLDVFYYLPECVLACVISNVALTLIEECPGTLRFYWKIRGYDEIGIFALIVVCTFFWSPEIGLSLGIGLSVIKVIKFSTRTRIQILGRVPKTNIFRNADELIEENFDTIKSQKIFRLGSGGEDQNKNGFNAIQDLENNNHDFVNQLENIEKCLVVKITEPLIFANSNELKLRLKRIEKYGSLNIHPSQPSTLSKDEIKYIIVDCKSMTLLDSSAALTLYEIVQNYYKHDYIILFTRIPFNLALRKTFVDSGIAKVVKRALEKQGGFLFSNSIISNNSYAPNTGVPINTDGMSSAAGANSTGALDASGYEDSNSGIHGFSNGSTSRNDSLENLLPVNSTMNYSIGLGDGFYTSIDDALKVVAECETRKNRINNKRPYI